MPPGRQPMDTPFNVDDNLFSAAGIETMWYAVTVGGTTAYVTYKTQLYNDIAMIISYIKVFDGTDTYEFETSGSSMTLNGNTWGGGEVGIDMLGTLGLYVSGKATDACGNPTSAWLSMMAVPHSWDTPDITQIGGVYYWMWKEALSHSIDDLNNLSEPDFDGISDFLSGVGKSRTTFETGDPLATGVMEALNRTVAHNIWHLFNDLLPRTGSVDYGWDPLMHCPSSSSSSQSANCTICPGLPTVMQFDVSGYVSASGILIINHITDCLWTWVDGGNLVQFTWPFLRAGWTLGVLIDGHGTSAQIGGGSSDPCNPFTSYIQELDHDTERVITVTISRVLSSTRLSGSKPINAECHRCKKKQAVFEQRVADARQKKQ